MQIVYSQKKKKKKKVNCVALIYSSFFLKMRERERERERGSTHASIIYVETNQLHQQIKHNWDLLIWYMSNQLSVSDH